MGARSFVWHLLVHVLLHVGLPWVAACTLGRAAKLRNFALMLAGNLIDLDHLLADVVYDPHRCSLGFHPLHSLPAVAAFVLLVVLKRTRFLGLGLLIHLAIDALDCGWMALTLG